MRNIDIFDEDDKVIVMLNGTRTEITSCKKFNNLEVMGKFANAYSIQHMYIKEDIVAEYTKVGDLFGCAVANVTKMLNGAINRMFIDPNYALMKRLGYYKGRFDYKRGDMVLNRKEMIHGFIADGNTHLAGFGLLWDDASVAKKSCGKGLWKALCKNSKSRNDMMAKMASFYPPGNNAEVIRFLQAIPSSLFKFSEIINFFKLGPNFAKEIVKNLGKPMCKAKPDDVMLIGNVANDCRRMLGAAFNPNWPFTRMKREHEKETKRIRDRAHTDDNYPYYDLLPHVLEADEYKGYQATLIRSPRQLVELGDEQHHCVGSYSNTCWNGTYVVYVIVDKEGLISTLGFGVGRALMHSQHYTACNGRVDDEIRRAFGTFIKNRIEKKVMSKIEEGVWVAKEELIQPTQVFLQAAPDAAIPGEAPFAAPQAIVAQAVPMPAVELVAVNNNVLNIP